MLFCGGSWFGWFVLCVEGCVLVLCVLCVVRVLRVLLCLVCIKFVVVFVDLSVCCVVPFVLFVCDLWRGM